MTDLMVLFEVSMYGGQDWEREPVLTTLEFLGGEAQKWYHRHILHICRAHLNWMFEDVVLGIYDRFVHPSTMQDARQDFMHAKYTPETGIQGFYNTLMDYAQNMVIYPDDYQIMEKFICGIPSDIRDKIFDCGLSLKVNTIDNLVTCAKAIKISQKTVDYYQRKMISDSIPVTRENPSHHVKTTPKPRATYPHHTTFISKPREDHCEEKREEVPTRGLYRDQVNHERKCLMDKKEPEYPNLQGLVFIDVLHHQNQMPASIAGRVATMPQNVLNQSRAETR